MRANNILIGEREMPSVSYWVADFAVISVYAYVPVIHNRRPKIVCFKPKAKSGFYTIGIIDLVDKTFQGFNGIEDGSDGDYPRIVDFNLSGSKLKARILYGHVTNNSWRLADIEIDLSALTGSRTLVAEKTPSDDSDIIYSIEKSQPISQRTLLIAEANKPYIWYVDAKDLSIIDKFDTVFSTYNPRISHKIVVKPDDIYILIGRHLDSANFYKYAVYGKTVTEISNSNPGGSPNPMICNMWVTHKERLLIGSSNTVEGVANSLVWFDDDFNLLGKTTLTSIYSTPYPSGISVVGKKSNGNLVIVGEFHNAHIDESTEASLVYLEIDPSNYSVANVQKLKTFTDPNNWIFFIESGFGTTNDHLSLPIIDTRTKKVYMPTVNKSNGEYRLGLVEFDLSDVDIVEWNLHSWFLNQTRIPTQLTLGVSPL